MRISIYLLISLFMALFGFFGMSCNDYMCDTTDTRDFERTVPLALVTDVGAGTRSAVKSKFVAGDKLGLFLYKQGSNNMVDNGGNLLSTLSDKNVWEQNFLLGDEKLKLYAYYPYSIYQSYPDIIFDISNQTPFMYGTHAPNTNEYVDIDNPTAHLMLEYVLGVAEFYFKKTDYPGPAKITKIVIQNSLTSTNKPIPSDLMINVVTKEFKTMGDDRSIILHNDNGLTKDATDDYPESGVVASVYTTKATTNIGDIQITFTVDGKDITWHMPVGTNWERGKKYSYYVILSPGRIQIDSVTIEELQKGDEDHIVLN